MSWVMESSQATLASRLVLLAIANHAKADGTDAWPSVATLAKEARISEVQTHRCIKRLQKIGELAIEIAAGPKGTNLYRLPKFGQLALNDTPHQIDTPSNRSKKTGTPPSFSAHPPIRMAPEPSLKATIIESKENHQVVPVAVWLAFVEMRKKIRAPLTERAGEIIRNKLADLAAKGQDPVACLEQSIERSWRGVFEVKENGNARESFDEAKRRRSQEAISDLGRGSASVLREVGSGFPDARSNKTTDGDLFGGPRRLGAS